MHVKLKVSSGTIYVLAVVLTKIQLNLEEDIDMKFFNNILLKHWIDVIIGILAAVCGDGNYVPKSNTKNIFRVDDRKPTYLNASDGW